MAPDKPGLRCRGHRIDNTRKPPRKMLIIANNNQSGLPLDLFEIWLDGNSQLERKALVNDGAANQILRRITPGQLAKAIGGETLRVSEIMGGRA